MVFFGEILESASSQVSCVPTFLAAAVPAILIKEGLY